jgi:hypothetical protein
LRCAIGIEPTCDSPIIGIGRLQVRIEGDPLFGPIFEWKPQRVVLDDEIERHGIVQLDLDLALDFQLRCRLLPERGDSRHIVVEVPAPGHDRLRDDGQCRGNDAQVVPLPRAYAQGVGPELYRLAELVAGAMADLDELHGDRSITKTRFRIPHPSGRTGGGQTG